MNHLTEFQLNEYLDDALSASEHRTIEKHLSGCADCHEKVEALRSLFQRLAELPEESLQRDLTPVVLSRLPDQKLHLGWKLALAVQSGIALGLTILVTTRLLPLISKQSMAAFFTLKIPLIEIPTLHPLSFNLPTLGIQPSTANLLFLAGSALILWGVGNATLLRSRRETKS